MRANLVVLTVALLSSCSQSVPDAVEVLPEQPAPQPQPAGNAEILTVVREVSEQCRALADFEALLETLLVEYTNKHPDVIATRRAIERLRAEIVSEEVCRSNAGPQVQELVR